MPVNLTITADDAAGLVDEFRRLNTLTATTAVDVRLLVEAMPINDFIELANARLGRDHFKIVDILPAEQTITIMPPEPEPEPAPKTTAKKAKAESITEAAPPSNIEEFPQPRRPKPSLAPIEEPAGGDPEGDRQHVLDTLAGILKDPARKAEVLAFTGKQAKLHGTEKISELPAAPFPAIRREMEKAFPDVRSSA
jgi:hypothetical protein